MHIFISHFSNVSTPWITHDTTAQTITITDGTTIYTIMDRNLGASQAWTGSTSYGNYYQRGNNYGFANAGTVSTSSELVPNASNYGPSFYYSGSTFITSPGVGSASNYDYWTGGQNDNLRWWSGDIQANGWDSKNERTSRQWPCPSGYHIPSAGEWSGLVMTRWNTIGSGGATVSTSSGLPYFSDATKATQFRNDFLLPLAGYRYYDSSATVGSQGIYGFYWSSSPNSAIARFLYLSTSDVSAYNYLTRAYGQSLRCFKDSV